MMFNPHKKHGFFPGPWHESPFHKGDLKYIILDLVQEKPSYGYDIIRALEERSRGFYTPSAGSVYPTLQMLEEMGYVASVNQDGKKIYTITDEGRKFLVERRHFADKIKSKMQHHWDSENMVEMTAIMDEFEKMGRLIGRQLHHLDSIEMKRIQEILSDVYDEIEAIIQRDIK